MFATRSGTVRRNEMSDFEQINRAGKIAMKLDEGDMIAGVEICTGADDVMLTTAQGQCIRFPVDDVRVFKGRDSTGVRGIRLEDGDHLISMSILRHVEASADERAAFLKMSRAVAGEEADANGNGGDEEATAETTISPERYVEMGAAEQTILTVSSNGYGKRTSSYEYRITGRGGKGIVAMAVNERNGPLVASFPVENEDQIMLVTDGGQLIRCPVSRHRQEGPLHPGRHRLRRGGRRARGFGRAHHGCGGSRRGVSILLIPLPLRGRGMIGSLVLWLHACLDRPSCG
jgi:DNA gyrase subunit A